MINYIKERIGEFIMAQKLKSMIPVMKPILVWCYIHFDGVQHHITEFLCKQQTIPDFQLNEDLENVNLDDFVCICEVHKMYRICEKYKYDKDHTLCIKLSDCGKKMRY